jgi:hypothetical protein
MPLFKENSLLYEVLKVGTIPGQPLAISQGLEIPEHDEIVLSYTGSNLTGVVYKLATATVATLTLAYDGNDNLTSVTKS